jgi:Pyruvate/2-oxoacid:ferredoxin oxidoreductase delta subunit
LSELLGQQGFFKKADPAILAAHDKIVSDQFPNLTGPVNKKKKEFSGAEEATRVLKEYVLKKGADLVGICTIKSFHMFKGFETDFKHAIVIEMEMKNEEVRAAPHVRFGLECYRVYRRLGKVVIDTAPYIRKLGYGARGHHPYSGRELIYIPMAIDAGLGELGKHGSLLTEKLGSSLRLGVVSTELPLVSDAPRYYGFDTFCTSCVKCRKACPGQAIHDKKKANRDMVRFLVDMQACLPNFATANGCGICLSVCPWYKLKSSPQMIKEKKSKRKSSQ